jgi:voltage-gated potassium channel Kch
MKALQPDDNEVKELRNHVIIAGYGRAGQIIASMLSELLIPFVALDVRSDRCV